jgi:hypothetical protein
MRSLVLVALLLSSGCFDVEEPPCAFACGPARTCPDNYECRSDGYCHRKGSTEACMFSDAAAAPDQSAAVDFAVPPDQSMTIPADMSMVVEVDLSSTDL